MIFFCLFLIGSRLITVFPALYSMRQGYRVSLLPAINLCQMSELSLVVLTLGKASGDVSEKTAGIAAFAFAFLAVGSTYAILKNDQLLRRATPRLNRLGLRDLDQVTPETGVGEKQKRICLLGFSWTASSLIEEISRERPDLLSEIVVVDFNPNVYEKLRQRKVRAVYGDITERDVLHHAGISESKIIICSLPNMVLKGANNLKILQQLRELNPAARIIVHAELLSDIPVLYAAGANFVSTPRLLEAGDLLHAIEAAEKDMLGQKRDEQLKRLVKRNEVIP
jgi:Trk K+ transport system NAD-binding subunit